MRGRPRRSLFARIVIAYTRALLLATGLVGVVVLSGSEAPSGVVLGGVLACVTVTGLILVIEYALTRSAPLRMFRVRVPRSPRHAPGAARSPS